MQMEHPSPRSLILDLLSTLQRGSMPVAALVEAGDLFGIPGGSVRVALARLFAAGRVARDSRGRYRVGPQALPVQRWVGGWRRLDAQTRSWDGSWHAVHLPTPGTHAPSQRALLRLGFREFRPGLQLRAANRRGGTTGLRDALSELGLEASALVYRLRELEPADDAAARRIWDVTALETGYRKSSKALERSTRKLRTASEERRMVETFLLGGSVIQQLATDPLLPEEIVPGKGRRELVAAMLDYDRLGRGCWGSLLARHGVPHRSAPLDTRLLEHGARDLAGTELRG